MRSHERSSTLQLAVPVTWKRCSLYEALCHFTKAERPSVIISTGLLLCHDTQRQYTHIINNGTATQNHKCPGLKSDQSPEENTCTWTCMQRGMHVCTHIHTHTLTCTEACLAHGFLVHSAPPLKGISRIYVTNLDN